jgi:hypothetical protein
MYIISRIQEQQIIRLKTFFNPFKSMIGRYRYLTGTGTFLVPVPANRYFTGTYRYRPTSTYGTYRLFKKKKKNFDFFKKCIVFQLLLIFFQ